LSGKSSCVKCPECGCDKWVVKQFDYVDTKEVRLKKSGRVFTRVIGRAKKVACSKCGYRGSVKHDLDGVVFHSLPLADDCKIMEDGGPFLGFAEKIRRLHDEDPSYFRNESKGILLEEFVSGCLYARHYTMAHPIEARAQEIAVIIGQILRQIRKLKKVSIVNYAPHYKTSLARAHINALIDMLKQMPDKALVDLIESFWKERDKYLDSLILGLVQIVRFGENPVQDSELVKKAARIFVEKGATFLGITLLNLSGDLLFSRREFSDAQTMFKEASSICDQNEQVQNFDHKEVKNHLKASFELWSLICPVCVELWAESRSNDKLHEKMSGLLESKDAMERAASVRALGTLFIEKDTAQEIAKNCLKDPDGQVRLEAVDAIGNIGRTMLAYHDVYMTLERRVELYKQANNLAHMISVCLKDKDRKVRMAAVKGLGDMAYEDFAADLDELWDPEDTAIWGVVSKAVEGIKYNQQMLAITKRALARWEKTGMGVEQQPDYDFAPTEPSLPHEDYIVSRIREKTLQRQMDPYRRLQEKLQRRGY